MRKRTNKKETKHSNTHTKRKTARTRPRNRRENKEEEDKRSVSGAERGERGRREGHPAAHQVERAQTHTHTREGEKESSSTSHVPCMFSHPTIHRETLTKRGSIHIHTRVADGFTLNVRAQMSFNKAGRE